MSTTEDHLWNALRATVEGNEPTAEAVPAAVTVLATQVPADESLHLQGEAVLRFPDGAVVHVRDTLLLDQFGKRRVRPTGGNSHDRPTHHSRRVQGFGSVEAFHTAVANAQRRMFRGEPQYGLAGMRADLDIHRLIGGPTTVRRVDVLWLERSQIAYTFGLILTELPE